MDKSPYTSFNKINFEGKTSRVPALRHEVYNKHNEINPWTTVLVLHGQREFSGQPSVRVENIISLMK